MNVLYYVYDKTTGKIVKVCDTDAEFIPLQVSPGQGYGYGTADHTTRYVPDGQLADRPVFGVSPGATSVPEGGTITISGIPRNTVGRVQGEEVKIIDGSLSVTLPYAGTYMVTLEKFPFQDWAQEYICTST